MHACIVVLLSLLSLAEPEEEGFGPPPQGGPIGHGFGVWGHPKPRARVQLGVAGLQLAAPRRSLAAVELELRIAAVQTAMRIAFMTAQHERAWQRGAVECWAWTAVHCRCRCWSLRGTPPQPQPIPSA